MGLFDFFKRKVQPKEAEKSQQTSSPSVTVTIGSIVTESSPTHESSSDDIVPIETRMRSQHPVCDGLYPHEVLVLSYAPKFCDSGNTFQGFWWYRYGIGDVQAILKKLETEGYILVGGIIDAVNMEKLPTIKAQLQKHNLKISGKKADLVARLVENVSETELSEEFTKRPYVLSETGKVLVKKYEWIPYIHSHGIEDLDIWNLTDMVQTKPYMKYRDKIWGYLNQRGMEHVKNGNFGLYRNSRFTMSEFVAEEKKIRTAFSLLCEVIAYDLSGLSNGFNKQYMDIYVRSYFPYEKSIVTMAPGITERVRKYADELGFSDENLHEEIRTEIEKLKLPFSVFTPDECADIVVAELRDDKTTLGKIYTKAETRFRQQYKLK